MLQWLIERKTILIKNSTEMETPSILLTNNLSPYNFHSICANKMRKHLEENDLISEEQITEDSCEKKKGLSMTLIDYQKAFDTIYT